MAGLLTLVAPAAAQESAQQAAGSTGTIFQPIVLSKDADLEFGVVVRPTAGSGTISIDPETGARTLTGQGALLASGATASRAAFTVGGEGGQTFSITVPSDMVMTRAGGSETVTVTLAPSATSGVLSGALGGPGSASFGVGGELAVADTSVTGAYTGAFSVTVAYN